MQLLNATARVATPRAGAANAVEQALRRQVDAVASRHFRRHPQSLGVVVAGSDRPAGSGRWVQVDAVDEAGAVPATVQAWRRPGAIPVLALDLSATPVGDPRWRRWCRLADVLPPGSTLLLRVDDAAALRALRDADALCQRHRRLRLDAMHRPLAEAGLAAAARGLWHELLHGQPALALCELGIDP
jgi:hypothetical protein